MNASPHAHPRTPRAGTVTLYTTSWCPYCSLLVSDLTDAGIEFETIDVENAPDAAAASAAVEKINGGNRVVPTVVFPDGTTATNPGVADVRLRLSAS
ncbi:glutaredoxin domain-containing protein [Mobilicoccus caccae]|uniref:NrdH-redoxin n=1 Tax=Mobilicoccus caccae TaxID=1859295 RepID=A0ABQ6IP77_9MICO|nr:glutaredoxin domain-containing protein [Mobilicoccus caccae]GMA38896.1 NrdH-redoxin [Mobilicoccus caccae]